MAIKKALITKERYEEELLKIPGVVGVGVSYVDNKPVIVVFVREVTPEVLMQIPARIEGIEVIVKQTEMPVVTALLETKKVLPVATEASRTARWRPIPGGVSIGHPKITAGTFTCKVYDRETGEPLGLSNNHVIALRWGSLQVGKKGDPILQPGCYSEDTRVLTKRGFLHFYEVTYEDEVLTLNLKTGELEWQKPTKIHVYRYVGPMIEFKGQMYDLLVTPNHNMVVKRQGDDKWFFVTAEEILNGQFNEKIEAKKLVLERGYGRKRLAKAFNKSMGWAQKVINKIRRGEELKKGIKHTTLELPKTGKWNCSDVGEYVNINGISIPTDEWLQFLGFWLAEGSIYLDKKGGYRVIIKNTNKELLERIASIVRKWGFKVNISKHGQLEFFSKQIYMWLKENCFTVPYDSIEKRRKARYKRIPPQFKELPAEKLRILLYWMFLGDGTFEKNKFRKYTTASRRLAEDVAEIALKSGYAVSIRKGRTGIYIVGISNRNITPRITKKPRVVHYDGYVYCLTVPNHTLVVERNGKITICGNSYDGGTVDRDTVGYLERWEEVRLDKPNLIDGAVFKPKTKDILRDDVLDIGPPQHVVEPMPGMVVRKSGRTCGLMANIITAVGVTVQVLGWGVATFRDQIWIAGPIIFPGDSGSIVTTEDGHVVGVAFAGTPFTAEGIACKAVHVERLLNISFTKTGKQIFKPEIVSITLGVLGGATAGALKALAERKKLYSPEEIVYA